MSTSCHEHRVNIKYVNIKFGLSSQIMCLKLFGTNQDQVFFAFQFYPFVSPFLFSIVYFVDIPQWPLLVGFSHRSAVIKLLQFWNVFISYSKIYILTLLLISSDDLFLSFSLFNDLFNVPFFASILLIRSITWYQLNVLF